MRYMLAAAVLAAAVLAVAPGLTAQSARKHPAPTAIDQHGECFDIPPLGLKDQTIMDGRVCAPKVRGLSIADALTLERKAGIWWEYAREIDSIDSQLHNQQSDKWTVFVPTDSAIRTMPRKPHQGADGSTPADDKVLKANVLAFLGAHIVPDLVETPSKSKIATLGGKVKVEVQRAKAEGEEDKWVVQPGDVPVVWVRDVMNGRILLLDGVIPYES